MKKIILITLVTVFAFASCEKLAEEETPVCKDCLSIRYLTSGMTTIDTPQTLRLCGGDVIAWENFDDKVEDSTTIKYYCH
jgi:hypothetical protein